MRKLYILFIALLATVGVKAVTFDADTYYYIQFVSGRNVVSAVSDGEICQTLAISDGDENQLWKITGSSTTGYTLVSKSGLTMSSSSKDTGGMFSASKTPGSISTFTIKNSTLSGYTDKFVIYPKGASGEWMNQYGGIGVGNKVGLWNSEDVNCPVIFISEAEYRELVNPDPATSLIPRPTKLTKGTGTVSADTEVTYKTDASLADEEYKLDITSEGITITCKATDGKGRINAEQTLRQLTLLSGDGTVPCVSIEDKPRFGYRGLMLDVARHFFTKEDVEKLLDVMALYHFSILHWHLTDDQGWRVEIPEYPKLTTVGAVRKASFCVPSSTTFYDDTQYGVGMYYTLDELKEVVEYAAERGIEIIPEYDLPGHNVAAVASYPELLASTSTPYEGGTTFEVRVLGGISKDVLNVGKPEVMTFLKCVLGHLAEVFPSQYIHLGGDECPTNAWENCAEVQQLMKDEDISSLAGVQPWLLEQLGTWLKDTYGKTVVCWDELIQNNKWPSTNTVKPVIMAWNNISYEQTAANLGFKSICVPYQYLYLDFMQALPENCEFDEPYYGGWSETNVNTLDEIYGLNPTDGISSSQSNMVMGPQGNLWTETCSTVKEMQHCYFPRALALSEIAWTKHDDCNWTNFLARMQNHAKVLNTLGVHFATHWFNKQVTTDSIERERLIENTLAGEVGYPGQAAVDALKAASNDDLAAALKTFKAADITLPVADKYYEIQSASTYYKAHYAGSTAYKENISSPTLKIHFTQQYNPDELWIFNPSTVTTGKFSNIKNVFGKVFTASSVSIKPSTVANDKFDYVPGDVLIATTTKVYYANMDGTVTQQTASDDDNKRIGYPGTWKIVEVKDFAKYLNKLLLSLTDIDQKVQDYGKGLVEAGNVTKHQYDLYLTTYKSSTHEVPQELKDLATGIDDVEQSATTLLNNKGIYNLKGQQVKDIDAAEDGIYIIDGNKYIK